MRQRILACLAILVLASLSVLAVQDHSAGQKKPMQSPPATAEGMIGGKKVTVKYHAPSMRGRKIMGELVPYGKVWRTGANDATTLITETDLTIGNLRVPAGTYTLYTLPGESEWKLIVNKQTKQWGTEYKEDQDLGRVNLTAKKLDAPVEKFTISIEPAGDSATLKMAWENTEVSVPVAAAK